MSFGIDDDIVNSIKEYSDDYNRDQVSLLVAIDLALDKCYACEDLFFETTNYVIHVIFEEETYESYGRWFERRDQSIEIHDKLNSKFKYSNGVITDIDYDDEHFVWLHVRHDGNGLIINDYEIVGEKTKTKFIKEPLVITETKNIDIKPIEVIDDNKYVMTPMTDIEIMVKFGADVDVFKTIKSNQISNKELIDIRFNALNLETNNTRKKELYDYIVSNGYKLIIKN